MKLEKIVVGPIRTNCYLVIDEKNDECMIIDPGDDGEKIARFIEAKALVPRLIVNTHGHFDHVLANEYLKKEFNIPVYAHKGDLIMYREQLRLPAPDHLVEEGDEIKVGGLRFKVMHTPGHSPGGICLVGEGCLFSGDTLFRGDCGRCDIPLSSEEKMEQSLKKLASLAENYKVYPGHGRASTLDEEKKSNPYLITSPASPDW